MVMNGVNGIEGGNVGLTPKIPPLSSIFLYKNCIILYKNSNKKYVFFVLYCKNNIKYIIKYILFTIFVIFFVLFL